MSEALLNEIHVTFGALKTATTKRVSQWAYGQVLVIHDDTLPAVFEAYYSNSRTKGEAKPQIGTDGRVDVPDEYFISGADIYVFIMAHEGAEDGRYEKVAHIPIDPCSKPSDVEPEPVQHNVIDQAIAALDNAVTQTGQDKAATAALAEAAAASSLIASRAANQAQGSASAAASSYDDLVAYGNQAVQELQRIELAVNDDARLAEQSSFQAQDYAERAEAAETSIKDMTVSASTLPAGSSATVEKTEGATSFNLAFGIPKGADGSDGQDGQDGQDGISPTISVTDITGGHRITITDAQGAHSFDVMDGQGGGVSDVQVNGASVVSNGVAEIPVITSLPNQADPVGPGLIKLKYNFGLTYSNGWLSVNGVSQSQVKTGSSSAAFIPASSAHWAAFYGLAKVAGADMASLSNVTLGIYPEAQKSAISQMLNAPVQVSGTTPTIVGKAGIQYVCGEVATLDFTPPSSGICDVIFTSGSTPTVLTVPSTVKWAGGFDPTSLEADTTYELNILNGLGVVQTWATS